MSIAEEQLLDMISKSQYGKTEAPDEFWYSYPNQKILAFELARDLVVAGEDVNVAIETAKNFIDTFYMRAMKPHSWERQ
ncbi:MAG: hypothetical protein II336_15275 [Loktanella sp.]|nr:hypothetical protein [Loktanella sp.]